MVWAYSTQIQMSLNWVVSTANTESPLIRLSSDTPDGLPRKGLIAKTRIIDTVRVYSEVKKFWSKPTEQMIVFEDDFDLLGDYQLAFRYVYGKNASQWLVTVFELKKIIIQSSEPGFEMMISQPTDVTIQL